MHTFRRPTLLALCLLLSACGSAPSPTQPTPADDPRADAAIGGGGGDTQAEAAPLTGDQPPADAPATLDAVAPPGEATPTPAPTATPVASVGSGGGTGGGQPAATPTPTPTPSATPSAVAATPTPAPSATPTPAPAEATQRTLTVSGSRHLVEVKDGKAFGTSPFTVTGVTTEAYSNKAAGTKFTALAGATRGRYGWRYGRITADNASEWGGDIGGPGSVFFLDSVGGEADNDGSWVITERYDDGSQVHTQRTEVFAKTDLCTFDPARVAFANLGTATTGWKVSAAWEGATSAPTTYPGGCFVVFTRPDGLRDFAVVGPGETTLQAKGYVYAFFITAAPEHPDGDLKLTLTPQ